MSEKFLDDIFNEIDKLIDDQTVENTDDIASNLLKIYVKLRELYNKIKDNENIYFKNLEEKTSNIFASLIKRYSGTKIISSKTKSQSDVMDWFTNENFQYKNLIVPMIERLNDKNEMNKPKQHVEPKLERVELPSVPHPRDIPRPHEVQQLSKEENFYNIINDQYIKNPERISIFEYCKSFGKKIMELYEKIDSIYDDVNKLLPFMMGDMPVIQQFIFNIDPMYNEFFRTSHFKNIFNQITNKNERIRFVDFVSTNVIGVRTPTFKDPTFVEIVQSILNIEWFNKFISLSTPFRNNENFIKYLLNEEVMKRTMFVFDVGYVIYDGKNIIINTNTILDKFIIEHGIGGKSESESESATHKEIAKFPINFGDECNELIIETCRNFMYNYNIFYQYVSKIYSNLYKQIDESEVHRKFLMGGAEINVRTMYDSRENIEDPEYIRQMYFFSTYFRFLNRYEHEFLSYIKYQMIINKFIDNTIVHKLLSERIFTDYNNIYSNMHRKFVLNGVNEKNYDELYSLTKSVYGDDENEYKTICKKYFNNKIWCERELGPWKNGVTYYNLTYNVLDTNACFSISIFSLIYYGPLSLSNSLSKGVERDLISQYGMDETYQIYYRLTNIRRQIGFDRIDTQVGPENCNSMLLYSFLKKYNYILAIKIETPVMINKLHKKILYYHDISAINNETLLLYISYLGEGNSGHYTPIGVYDFKYDENMEIVTFNEITNVKRTYISDKEFDQRPNSDKFDLQDPKYMNASGKIILKQSITEGKRGGKKSLRKKSK